MEISNKFLPYDRHMIKDDNNVDIIRSQYSVGGSQLSKQEANKKSQII